MKNSCPNKGRGYPASKEMALLEQGPDHEANKIIAKLLPRAKALKIGIHITSSGAIHISRWGFYRSFNSSVKALQFLKQIGLE